ncbi:MAG: hypothetical protein FWG50_01355 [Kiritimatiellaeota bacterium]|nr:hypothetical protein [Kiritimatiellota bacterium]
MKTCMTKYRTIGRVFGGIAAIAVAMSLAVPFEQAEAQQQQQPNAPVWFYLKDINSQESFNAAVETAGQETALALAIYCPFWALCHPDLWALIATGNGAGKREEEGGVMRGGGGAVTSLVFTATSVVETGAGKVLRTTAAWPLSQDFPDDKLVVIWTPLLKPAYWDWFDEFDVVPAQGSAVIDLPMYDGNGFFALATLADTTGSGIPDIYEWIEANNPLYGDSDNDGLPDWYEEWIGTDPENPFSIAEGDPNNPEYHDEFGNPLTDGEIVAMWGEPGEEREDLTPPEWNGLIGLDLTLKDMDLYDDAWELHISVPYRDVPDTNAFLNPAGWLLTNVGDVTQVAARTVFVEAGQNVRFKIGRIDVGQIAGTDEFAVTIDAFIPVAEPSRAGFSRYPAPNWLAASYNPDMFAVVSYGPNGEPPDVSQYVWDYTGHKAYMVTVDDDDNGVCVLKYTPITMRCVIDPNPILAYAPVPFTSMPAWQFRAKGFDGGWGAWYNIPAGYGSTVCTYAPPDGGVFGIRVYFCGADHISPVYRRKKDDLSGTLSATPSLTSPNAWWRKGQPNAVGVCDTQFQVDLRNAARPHIGSTAFARASLLPEANGLRAYGAGVDKCTLFVAHMCRSLDRDSVPRVPRRSRTEGREWLFVINPPWASEWHSGSFALRRWPLAPTLQPGLVISTGHHVGITDYDGEGINAGSEKVHKAYNFFQHSESVYRRYEP